MTDDDRRRAAQTILEIPYFHQLWDELEQAAINATINAKMNDDETRRNAAAEARAIRNVRSRLRAIAEEKETKSRRAPA